MFGEKKVELHENFYKSVSIPLWLIVAFMGFYLLYLGKTIFVSLILSFFLIILFTGIYTFFRRYISYKYISIGITIFIFLIFFYIVGFIISNQFESFLQDAGKFEEGLRNVVNYAQTKIPIDFTKEIFMLIQQIDISSISRKLIGTVTNFGSILGSICIFTFFLLLEKQDFGKKLSKIFNKRGKKKVKEIATRIYDDLNTFFAAKFFIALLNGVMSTVVMTLFGLDFALVFGFLVFLFDFIPTFGGIVALGLPFLYSFVQFSDISMSFLLLFCMLIPQTLTGNFLEPKIMGNRLNLSPFMIIISLMFWASFWGIIGAFLAVPIMTTINIVLAKFETTRPLAILFSKNGKL